MKLNTLAAKFRTFSIATVISVLSTFTPLGTYSLTFADDQSCSPASSNQNGVTQPMGADAGTFTYQCSGPYVGEWTNPYYVYNPADGTRTPIYDPNYTYDCTAKTWSMIQWTYSPSQNTFVSNRVAPPTTPHLQTNCPSTDPTSGVSTNATPTSTSQPLANQPGASLNNTGPDSNNSTNNTSTLNGSFANNTGVSMGNTVTNNAATGDASVVSNTTGGSAGTGDAQAVANIANLLQSTSNAFGPNTTLFTSNINGNVNGDFMFDPSAILASGAGSNNSTTNNLQVNTNTNNNLNAAINNNINVGATSGNATVAQNTNGGNATTGNADAIVNLMNLINSTVATGKSFVGTININGDLNGDILLPQGALDQLLASTGPNSNNNATNSTNATSTMTNNTTEAVSNNIASSAKSGAADISNNTSAGTATSGNTGTNVTLMNLTGSNTVGKNDLLVFVNVLGKWVGMIMNAPTGTTAADLGGGIISNSGPTSNNSTATNLLSNSTTNNSANLGINNNVNVHALSGDATVTDNTKGGTATTGNAHTAVNVLNMLGSNLSLSNWFGVLFINVFGIWNGSFGINTSAGDPVIANPTAPTNNPVQTAAQQSLIGEFHHLTGFTPHNAGNEDSNDTVPTASLRNVAVLGASTAHNNDSSSSNTAHQTTSRTTHASYLMPIIGLCLAGLILLAGERDRLFRR